jgi:Ca2+-binding RTX toxin-like protein
MYVRFSRWFPLAMLVVVALTAQGVVALTAGAAQGPVGAGLTVTPSDLAFILKQIKIAEQHAATLTPDNPCGTQVGPGPDQIPDALTSYGLRTVDGSCNNLLPGRERLASADQPFPRLTTPVFRTAELTPPGFGPPSTVPSSYANKNANVFDSQPRLISNLIVDQTATNPAAVAAAGRPVRSQGNEGVVPCPDPSDTSTAGITPTAGCVPAHQTLFIPNVTTDVGLSPPYNSLFTFFGQFFDHGIDQTVKGGAAAFVPLRADDPLIAGPDHTFNTPDDLPAQFRFMVLTRAQNQPGPDGKLGTSDDVQDAKNTDSPWVDQSQTYTSHASHQVFLREYVLNTAGVPVSTGKLLGGPAGPTAGGQANWGDIKQQAATLLGLLLADKDALNVPMLATDPYGKFVPGPARGLPQYVTAHGLVEGDTASPVAVPADAKYFDTPFLTDIAHNADPSPVDADHNPRTPPTAPTPDVDTVASADFAGQPPGTYDDEMLNAHFVCGDGRCNENIALSTIHQVFHSEHNRLIADIQDTLTKDTSATGIAALAQWRLAAGTPTGWNGERLFQAARFINEMEYQHIVFEEFGRKVQPAIRPFHVYHTDINAAIPAEFAHAVYRFGHSMLDDVVARTNPDGTNNDAKLLDAFLNPPAFTKGVDPQGKPYSYTSEEAAGAIVMGSSDQVGNELDEFVTETLRNNLLGLPLDLAAINMARAREAGVPPLNGFRRQLWSATNDGQLKPYTSWADFGQNLKHPESLINFVAAYGKHPTITGQATLAGKRAAARAIVHPIADDTAPDDAADFMFGARDWKDTGGVTITGVDDIDLWVGGLAEVTPVFGGLLGTTFNYVFQSTMENLQEGDRFYYLNRTVGMNLRTQLEANSFGELIQRNTDGTHTLKADAFATADCKFELANLEGTPEGYAANGSAVANDPASECDETKLLLRKPDGTIQYRAVNSVDPAGINGQAVYNGTPGADRIWGGNDNDTFWGGDDSDVIEGNGGDDVALGGNGNDILTDLSGLDVLKGGPGNDAVDAGPGDDIVMGNDGQDFLNGGANDNETFAGPGNDFLIAGQGADVVFGDGGDDWIQGGSGQDLLSGDHAAPFFDDPAQAAPGNDIFIGQVGENDYDGEGGDDILSQNSAIDRNVGAAGFDWAIHQYDTVGADDDMAINGNLLGLPLPVVVNRDRWQEVEGDSGSAFDDIIKGDDAIPVDAAGGGFTGCDALDQDGLDRIAGLDDLVPPLTVPASNVAANSEIGFCPLTGNVWGGGNILIGGPGSDTITGRGGDDIIDGDKFLAVRISVRDHNDRTREVGSTDLMEHTFQAGNPKTLQQAVFDGDVDPGDLVAMREIKPGNGSGTDTAVYQAPRSSYTVTATRDLDTGLLTVTVSQIGELAANQTVSDGTDTLTNIENLVFASGPAEKVSNLVVLPPAPRNVSAFLAGGSGAVTVSWTQPAVAPDQPAVTGFEVVATTGGTVTTSTGIPAAATTFVVPGLVPGSVYTFRVRAVTAFDKSALSFASNAIAATAVPGVPTSFTAVAGNTTAALFWAAGTVGSSPTSGYEIQIFAAGVPVRALTVPGSRRSAVITGLTNGTSYTFTVRGVNAIGAGASAGPSAAVTPADVSTAPTSGQTRPGARGGALSVIANWVAPTSSGASPITGYRVTARRMAPDGTTQIGTPTVVNVGAGVRTAEVFVAPGTYRTDVVATSAVGDSLPSTRSNSVVPR